MFEMNGIWEGANLHTFYSPFHDIRTYEGSQAIKNVLRMWPLVAVWFVTMIGTRQNSHSGVTMSRLSVFTNDD